MLFAGLCERLVRPRPLARVFSASVAMIRRHVAPVRNRLLNSVAFLRRKLLRHATFIGVTGSCGKTTTTTLIGSILSASGKTQVGAGRNGTNRVVRNILSVDASTRYCVQELSATHLKASLSSLAPQIGVITNVGSDHYKIFRTLEAVAQAKGLLVERLPRTGTAILNADDPYVRAMAPRTRAEVITFGASSGAHIRATDISAAWPDRLAMTVTHNGESVRVETQLVGEHWVTSVLAAIACGVVCGVDLVTCATAVAVVEPVFGRCSVHGKASGAVYVLDSWKASLWTIASGLNFVKSARAPRKTVVFGTISDYSGKASTRYRKVAQEALDIADRVVFVGPGLTYMEKLHREDLRDRLFTFQTTYEASAFLSKGVKRGELIYIKASGIDHLERIMLSQLDEVVCWREKCGVNRNCPACRSYRTPAPSPHEFGATLSDRAELAPVLVAAK